MRWRHCAVDFLFIFPAPVPLQSFASCASINRSQAATPGDGPEPDLARRRCRLCRVSLDCRRARLLDDEVDSRKYRRAVRIRVPVRDCSQLRMPVWCGRLRHHVTARLASAVKRTFRQSEPAGLHPVRSVVKSINLTEARKHLSLRSGCCHAFERRSAGISTSHLTRLSKVHN